MTEPRKYKWHKIAEAIDAIDFAPNNIAVITVDDKTMCLGRHKQQLFAFAYKCPHAGGIMADGFIDVVGNVVCPVHRYKFNPQNGRNTSGEGYYLKHWPVEVKEEGVFVGIEEKGFFGWL
jgi:nitrite reductase/ring-hydroxylating ferredoxin subunit